MNLDLFRRQLERHEGRRRFPYQDTKGKWTIGIGHNLTDRGLTDRQIDRLCDDDIQEVVLGMVQALPWFSDLDEVRQRVLADIAFNAGVHGLLGFRQMLAAMVVHDWTRAERELLDSEAAREAPGRFHSLAIMLVSGRDSLPT